jgi:YesN/AraC family two-component response regulator
MTGETGLELIKMVRKKLLNQKAVIVSAFHCSESCWCHSLSKPYLVEELFSLLEALVKCEEKHQSKSQTFQVHCEFGLEHECPFYPKSSATK